MTAAIASIRPAMISPHTAHKLRRGRISTDKAQLPQHEHDAGDAAYGRERVKPDLGGGSHFTTAEMIQPLANASANATRAWLRMASRNCSMALFMD